MWILVREKKFSVLNLWFKKYVVKDNFEGFWYSCFHEDHQKVGSFFQVMKRW